MCAESGTAGQLVKKPDVIREELKELSKRVGEDSIKMEKLLFEVYSKNLWAKWDHKSFIEYLMNELDFKERKSYYMKQIVGKFKEVGFKAENLDEIGWSKAKSILNVMTSKNKEEWLEKAKTLGSRDLDEEVKKAKLKGNYEKMRRLTFVLNSEQSKNVDLALEKIGQITKRTELGYNLDALCLNFNSQSAKDKVEYLVTVLRALERNFPDMKLIAVKEDDETVVFGAEFVKKLEGTEEDEKE